jgi:uncharacterized protein YkwD
MMLQQRVESNRRALRARRRKGRGLAWRASGIKLEPLESRTLLSAWLNTFDRAAVIAFYQSNYLTSIGVAPGWTGSLVTGDPGTTSAAFQAAVLRRVNYYRAMAGVPAVTLNALYSQKAQAAALMLSANPGMSHFPPATVKFYTAIGAEAAGKSNLGTWFGPAAIDGYMTDGGASNTFVGHRRWILYPETQQVGTGDIPGATGGGAANALWVIDANALPARPATRDAYVAWPNAGYVPYEVMTPRWSFSVAGADFSHAHVTMTRNGAPVTLTALPVINGYGENTLAWDVTGAITPADTSYAVQISNAVLGGVAKSFTYSVTSIDPGVAPPPPPPPPPPSTLSDKTAPTPYTSNWTIFPHAISSNSIQMTASTASDPNGVQYYFHNLRLAGHDSGWQNSPTWTDSGLQANTLYSYEVRTRDSVGNAGAYSSAAGAATQPMKVAAIRPIARHALTFFDEAFYLRNNPDVALAVARGKIASAWVHFARYGQFEKRRPSAVFDERYYLAANPDVAWAVRLGLFKTGFQHFVMYGFTEGRRGAA